MNAGMSALQERNARVQYARTLGIAKPHTLKKDALEEAIAAAEAVKAENKAQKDAEKAAGDPFDEIDPTIEGDHLEEETVADVLAERAATREAWLLSAAEKIAPMLEQAGGANIVRKVAEGKISISVGFPSKTIRKRIGECWSAVASENGGTNHLFISPLLDDTIEVLGVVVHELIHADDDCESKHNGHFRKVALAVGLTGKMTSTEVGEDLQPLLKDLAEELGPYPHVKLKLGAQKKQTTRMLKAICDDSECPYGEESPYTIRLTKKWVEVGLPSCPCGAEMIVTE
jgi:hypothetical protein